MKLFFLNGKLVLNFVKNCWTLAFGILFLLEYKEFKISQSLFHRLIKNLIYLVNVFPIFLFSDDVGLSDVKNKLLALAFQIEPV
jgi:hypothetical protein